MRADYVWDESYKAAVLPSSKPTIRNCPTASGRRRAQSTPASTNCKRTMEVPRKNGWPSPMRWLD